MRHRRTAAALLATGLFASTASVAQPTVVASILPVQSLAAAVMDGVGTPTLLLPPGASPHAYGLRPSEAALLERADVVFWIGEGMEGFLAAPMANVAADARTVALADATGVTLLPFREGGLWEAHDHGDEAGHDHDDHDHAHDHDAEEPADMHVWLAPDNAQAMTRAIAAVLAEVDPANAARYAENAEASVTRLAALETEIRSQLEPVHDVPFVVFHDAYQYFDRAFALAAVGSVTVAPDVQPGTARIAELRQRIEAAGAACVFSEPQFEPRLVTMLVDGTRARTGVLDPLGSDLAPGPDAYPQLMRNLAASLSECLGDG